MKNQMIEVNIDFVIDTLEMRYNEVKDQWGCEASHELWELALDLARECGFSCSSASEYVDNYLINGEFQNKIDDMEYWVENTSQFDEINALQKSIDELDETDNQKGYQQAELGTLIDDAWQEYCQDNALIYNDEYACLQF